jgi:eukaryotic-like serine/threonine-protein kinase
MYDSSVVKRLQSERQSLAIMEHPAIAKVFDAAPRPQRSRTSPWSTSGLPISDHCDRKKLGINERGVYFCKCAKACATPIRRRSFTAT